MLDNKITNVVLKYRKWISFTLIKKFKDLQKCM